MALPRRRSRSRSSSASASLRVRPQVEALEARIVPYALTGGAWPSPQLVTISFMPDGAIAGVTGNGYAYSNLFQTLNARFGSPAVWEGIIEKAAQTWAAITNVNFSIVSDNGTPLGQGPDQQGDPNMGDIRIGGYKFGYNWLAQAYYPPPVNNYSAAGDIQFNTSVCWHNGSTYDLFTVALHEMGHALGLGESAIQSAVMYATYTGVKNTLTTDDISGVQAIYGPRAPDVYNSAGASDATEATAAVLAPLIDPTALTAVVPHLDLTSTSVPEWYAFAAPLNTSGSLTVTVQSAGLSLLTPQATLYASDGVTPLAAASAAGATDGATLTLSTGNVTPGEVFYVKVSGADNSVFSVGSYGLTLNFGSGASPTVTPPNTTLANGSSLQAGGSAPQQSDAFGVHGDGATSQALPVPAGPGAGTSASAAATGQTVLPQGQVLSAGPVLPAGRQATPPSAETLGETEPSAFEGPATSAALFIRLDSAEPLRGPRMLGGQLASEPDWPGPALDRAPAPASEIGPDGAPASPLEGACPDTAEESATAVRPGAAAAVFADYGASEEAGEGAALPAAASDGALPLPVGRVDLALAVGLVFGAAWRLDATEGAEGRRRLGPGPRRGGGRVP